MLTTCAICIGWSAAGPALAETQLSSYDRAVLARRAGRPQDAARLLEGWLGEWPADVDARLHYGYALLDLGRLSEAKGAFLHVLQQVPTYDDARVGLARVAQRRGETGRAREWLAPIRNSNAEASALHTQMAKVADLRWQLDAGASVSAVGRGQPDWRELVGQVRFQSSRRTSLVGRVEATRRFGLQDIYGEAQVAGRFSPDWSAYLLAGATPDPNYRPRWQVGGGLAARVRAGANPTVLTVDLRHARYPSDEVLSLQPGVEQYMLNGKAWINLNLLTLNNRGKTHAGAFGRLNLQASPTFRLFAGAGKAPDTAQGVVTQVTTLLGGVELSIGPQQGLRLSLAHTDQKGGADRMEVAAGLLARF